MKVKFYLRPREVEISCYKQSVLGTERTEERNPNYLSTKMFRTKINVKKLMDRAI